MQEQLRDALHGKNRQRVVIFLDMRAPINTGNIEPENIHLSQYFKFSFSLVVLVCGQRSLQTLHGQDLKSFLILYGFLSYPKS